MQLAYVRKLTYVENPLLQLSKPFNNNYCKVTPITSDFKRLLKTFHQALLMSQGSEDTENKNKRQIVFRNVFNSYQ